MISQYGNLNTTALGAPELLVQIVPPQNILLNGVPSGVLAVVGTATFGPVNQVVTLGTPQQCQSSFGPLQARKYDLGTQVATAYLQGCTNFKCVRVTDGTDTAATGTLVATCLTLTALYSGTLGNTIQAQLVSGSKAGTFRLVVGAPGFVAEVYDNLSGTGNAFWLAVAAAVNSGTGTLRGPSNLIRATAGAGTTAAAAMTSPVTLAGGTDGVATITAAVLIGLDSSSPRTGMYALRASGASVLVLADADDSTQWTVADAFGLSEGMLVYSVAPSGSSIAATITAKQTAGLDSYSTKLLHGDWLLWNDPVNLTTRLVSPQGFAAGRRANLSPQNSSLNKELYGVVGSQRFGAPGTNVTGQYAKAELDQLEVAGIDVITNPAPAGSIWAVRNGINSSSNASVRDETYTTMTNYIAATLNAGMGLFIGQPINSQIFLQVRSTLLAFLQGLLGQGLLSDDYGTPFSVVCDTTNNPQTRTALGYLQADVAVRYMATTFYLIVNLQGGATVTITQANTQAA